MVLQDERGAGQLVQLGDGGVDGEHDGLVPRRHQHDPAVQEDVHRGVAGEVRGLRDLAALQVRLRDLREQPRGVPQRRGGRPEHLLRR